MHTLGLPSIDGLGSKRWLCGYIAGGSQEVKLYLRPRQFYGKYPWMLRIETRSGDHVETRFYQTRAVVEEHLRELFRKQSCDYSGN